MRSRISLRAGGSLRRLAIDILLSKSGTKDIELADGGGMTGEIAALAIYVDLKPDFRFIDDDEAYNALVNRSGQ